jgi:hypothetical protein
MYRRPSDRTLDVRLTVGVQFLLAGFPVLPGFMGLFARLFRPPSRSRSVKENIDNYEYKHRHAEQPC